MSAEKVNIQRPISRFLLWSCGVILILIIITTFVCLNYYKYWLFSTEWKISSIQKRRDIVNFELIYKSLRKKNAQKVIEFLGNPDGKEENSFYYELGVTGGAKWTLDIIFDKSKCVSKVSSSRRHNLESLKIVEKWLNKRIDTWKNGHSVDLKGFSWNMFHTEKLDEDELWHFKSPLETWKGLCGTAGYALVRNKKVIEYYITLVN